MFSDHFYHSQIRRLVSVFGTMFNNIYVHKTKASGELIEKIKVPISYGPRQKFLARLENQSNLTDPRLAIKLPRMSFEITSLTYDAPSAIKKPTQIRIQDPNDPRNTKTVFGPTPYRIGFSLSIIAKQQDDGLQVLEQILPYFKPDYTVTITDVPELNIKTDVPIVLNNVSMTDDYEGDYETRRAIIWTLDFEARCRFYTGVKECDNIIEQVSIDYTVNDAGTPLMRYSVEPTPPNAGPDDDYTYTEVYDFFLEE